MKGAQYAWHRIQILRVFGKLLECLLGRLEQDIGHALAVKAPERVQLRGQRKDDMVVRAIQQDILRVDQPLFGSLGATLGAGAVFAGVVPDSIQVAIFTVLSVPAQRSGSTSRPLAQGFNVMQRQCVASLKVRKMSFENLLYCMLDHVLRLDIMIPS